MSKSVETTGTEPGEQHQPYPRAIVHKQILDAARSDPNASIDGLAAAVSGASPSLVEQVIDEYGDPADAGSTSETATPSSADHSESSDDSSQEMENPDLESAETLEDAQLTEKQLETVHAIRETPGATQRDLGEQLGVTSATINQRVNSIGGFEWTNREQFVTRLLDDTDTASMTQNQSDETTADSSAETTGDPSAESTVDSSAEPTAEPREETPADSDEEFEDDPNDGAGGDATASSEAADDSPAVSGASNGDGSSRGETASMTTDDVDTLPAVETDNRAALYDRIESLAETITQLEEQLENAPGRPSRPFENPALVHKVVHACLNSDQITEEEELRILESLLSGERPNNAVSD